MLGTLYAKHRRCDLGCRAGTIPTPKVRNSGSPVIVLPGGNIAIGIHTNGGCTPTGGTNAGTSFRNAALWTAVRTRSNWHHNDLTNATGAAAAASDPAGYTWDVDSTQHVVYRGTDGHIHELWFSSATWNWNHNDLTNATGAPAAASDPAGYTWDVDNTQHVVYSGHQRPHPRIVV